MIATIIHGGSLVCVCLGIIFMLFFGAFAGSR